MNTSKQGKKSVFIFLITVSLMLGFTLKFTQAQVTEGLEQFELASLSASQAITPLISIDLQNAGLKNILKIFSQQAGLNFIASENVKERKVTLYLDSVSVEDALSTIMKANGLIYEQEKDSKIFVVKEWGKPEVETLTKVFALQYAQVKGYDLAEDESTAVGIKEIVEKLLTKNGSVVEDSRTNSVIITDIPGQFPKIEKAIAELDIKLPQVMIEAEIVEINVELMDKLGIEWGGTNGELISAAGAARTATFPFTKPQGVSKVGVGGAPSSLQLGYISANNLGGILALLHRDTETKLLARPKILTLNNETAEIKITADTAVASITETSSSEGIAVQSITAERVETGVTLKVTPQVNKKGEITMTIEPSVTNAVASQFFTQFVDPRTRSVKTTVTITDGQTVIIGGLINTEDTSDLRKVPFLGDIPLVGTIFRKHEDQTSDKELVIFITPHLIKDAQHAELSPPPWEFQGFGQKEEAMEKALRVFSE